MLLRITCAAKEDLLIIKVKYDALNRTFKLVDSEFKTLLEGDALYDLAIPLVLETGEEELFEAATTFVAHA
jgi:hypothetical protein